VLAAGSLLWPKLLPLPTPAPGPVNRLALLFMMIALNVPGVTVPAS